MSASGSAGIAANARRGYARWRLFFKLMFATDALFRFVRTRRSLAPVEELIVPGRRTGNEQRTLLQLITVEDRTYVVESSGMRSNWAANLSAASHATISYSDGRQVLVTACLVTDGDERNAAIDAMPENQPTPLRFVYRRALRHVKEVGRVFRLDPAE